jgi:O-antigen ligase
MRALSLHRVGNLPLAGLVIALSVMAGIAAGMGWSGLLAMAALLVLFLVLVRDIRLVGPLLIVVLPFGPRFAMSFGNLYLTTVVLIVALAAWIWRNPLLSSPFSFPLNPVLVGLVFFASVLGVSALQAIPYFVGNTAMLLRLIQFFLYTALFAMILQMDFSRQEIRRLVILALVVGVSEGLVGVGQWLARPGFYLSGTFDDQHNFFGIFCVFVMLLLIGVILETKSAKVGAICLAGLSAMVFSVVFSFSRGGYSALAAGIPVFFFTPVRPRRKAVLAVGAVVLAALIYTVVPQYIRERAYSIFLNVTGNQVGISFSQRLVMWKQAIASFLENPILGRGTGSSSLMDNFYFKVLADAGILGFGAFVGLLYIILREEWRMIARGTDDDLIRGITIGIFPASVACLVIYNLTGDFFGVHRFMGLFWILLALLIRYSSVTRQTGRTDGT